MQISLIIHSATGKTHHCAEIIGEGIKSVNNTDFKIMSVEDVDKEYVAQSDCVLIGTPTYYANMAWQVKKWFDEGGVDLSGKLGGVFATANVIGGGSETALLTMVNHMLVKGMLVYSAGCSKGKPYTHLGVTSLNEVPEENQREKIFLFGQRMAEKAWELFGK